MVSVRGIALVFWAPRFSAASTSFSNTFLEVLLAAFVYANIERGLDQGFSPPPAHSIAEHLRLPSEVHQARYRQTNQHDRVDPGRSGNLITFRHRKLIDNHDDQQRYLRQRKPNDQVSHYLSLNISEQGEGKEKTEPIS